MIPVAPGSEPIVCTQDEEDLVTAYSILREARHYFAQLEPSPALHADLKGAVRDFCFHYEQRIRGSHNPSPAMSSEPAAPPEILRRDVPQVLNSNGAAVTRSPIPTTEF